MGIEVAAGCGLARELLRGGLAARPRHIGPGYRAYCTRRGEVVYLLLLGDDKWSQKRDVKRAIEMAQALDKE